jgi:tripartite-type tricarboxylate transporter receptor subunit TctC
MTIIRLATAALLIATAASSAVRADEAEFYKGKTVKMIVGFGPGGGYDAYARMLAPYFSKRLGATVVVENQPGAGSLAALNRLYVAPPDGLQMMLVNGTAAALSQIVGVSAVKFDLGKMTHIATVSVSPWVWLVPKGSPIQTIADARKMSGDLLWGAGGPIDGMSDGAQVTCEALALKCRVVLGYKGSNDVALALARNEMASLYVSDTSANNYVRAGDVRPVANMSRKRSRFFPDLKTVHELEKLSPESEWLLDFHSTVQDLGRIITLPPNIPAARLAFLAEAARQMLTDKELIDEGEKSQRYIDFVDASNTTKNVDKVINQLTPEQRARVSKVMEIEKK